MTDVCKKNKACHTQIHTVGKTDEESERRKHTKQERPRDTENDKAPPTKQQRTAKDRNRNQQQKQIINCPNYKLVFVFIVWLHLSSQGLGPFPFLCNMPMAASSNAAHPPQQTSSAAQPAQQNATSLWPGERRTDVHGEAFSRIYSFHAYNVGWNWTDKGRDEKRLGKEISKLYEECNFDAIGISEIFEVEYDNDVEMKDKVEKQRDKILAHLLRALAAASSRAQQRAKSENPKWLGRIDGHCLYIWQQSLNLITSDYISLKAENQPWRKSQYFCFHPADCTFPIHIYHAHQPSPGRVSKSGKDRRFEPWTRRTVVKSIWEHISSQHSAQQQRLEVGVVQPDIPAVLVTGDWNMTMGHWKAYLAESLPNAVRPTVALVQSTMCKQPTHGDVTIAINCCTFQEETPTWTTFSDTHNVVIAKVMLPRKATVTPAPALVQEVPKTPSAPALVQEVPKALVQEVPPAHPPAPALAAHSSAEQPANIAANQLRAFDLQVPLTTTPLSAKLAENCAGLDPDDENQEALREFENTFMWGTVLGKPVPGHWDIENPSGVERLEWVLQLLDGQRKLHIQNMQYPHDRQFTDADMTTIMNTWRKNTDIWMQPQNLALLRQMHGPARHDFVKSRFNVMKFHLLGNEALVDHLIRFNLCGAVQPVVLQNFCRSWAAYKITPQHRKAQEMSAKQQPDHVRRAKRIWNLQKTLSQAKWIVEWVDDNKSRWHQLSAYDRNLYDTFQDLQTELADVLKTPAGQRFQGSASYMIQMPALTGNP